MLNRKPWLEQLRRRLIVTPIQQDPRSINGTLLGKPIDWIFKHAIGGGQADFDKSIENLSACDRVMLYAYLNQKAHVDELIHAFEKLFPDFKKFAYATVVDIGCGPFTAGLAIANVVGNQIPFRYFGVDHSSEMCALGFKLAQEVFKIGELNDSTNISFHQKTDEIDFGLQRAAEPIVFVLSYLLASNSIDVDKLVTEIDYVRNRIGLGQTIVLYTNSARKTARNSFPDFCEKMILAGFQLKVEDTEEFEDTDKPRSIHYALFVRPAAKFVPIAQF